MILESINSPADLKALSLGESTSSRSEIREFIVEAVSKNGGHLGSNLGVVELTLACTGCSTRPRTSSFSTPGTRHMSTSSSPAGATASPSSSRKAGSLGTLERGIAPRRDRELARLDRAQLRARHSDSLRLTGRSDPDRGGRFVVAVVGDGALTGGMAYEALNNLGHSGARVADRLERQREELRPDGVAGSRSP